MIHHPYLDGFLVTGFFDGAKQKDCCGVGMVIKLQLNHKVLLGMVVGKGTNTKAELLALWGLLWFAQLKNIHIL